MSMTIEMIDQPDVGIEAGAPFDGPYVGDATTEAAQAAAGAFMGDEPATTGKTSTELAVQRVQTTLAKVDKIELGLQDLEHRFKNVVFDVSTTKGMVEAKAARAEIREPRYTVQNVVKEAKQILDGEKRKVQARGDEIIARIAPLEDPIDEQIKAEENRKLIEKAKLEQEERDARAKIEKNIQIFTMAAADWAGRPWLEIQAAQAAIETIEITVEEFGDRAGEALLARSKAVQALDFMVQAGKALEAQQAEIDRRLAAAKEVEEANKRAEEERQAKIASDNAANAQRLADMEARLNAKAKELADQEAAARKAQQDKEDAERAEKQRIEDEARAQLQAKEDADRARLGTIRARIESLFVTGLVPANPTIEGLEQILADLEFEPTDFAQEIEAEATAAKAKAIDTVKAVLAKTRVAAAAEAARATARAEEERQAAAAKRVREHAQQLLDKADALSLCLHGFADTEGNVEIRPGLTGYDELVSAWTDLDALLGAAKGISINSKEQQ